MPSMTRTPLATIVLGTAAAMGAIASSGCSGPQLHVANPRLDDLYVDGRALPAAAEGTLHFRYYGTVRWRALPHDDGESLPDFRRRPAAGEVQVTPPVSQWLFPFDFPAELVHRLFAGTGDQTLVVELPEADRREGTDQEISPDALGALRQRAELARTAR